MRIGFPILLGVAGWTFTQLTDHESRLTRIEASRYTQADSKRDQEGVTAKLDVLNNNQVRLIEQVRQVAEILRGK